MNIVTTKVDTGLGSPVERFTRLMFSRIIAGLARTLHDEEMTVAQLAAIAYVDQAGTARVTELAHALSMSPSAASRLVDVLVERKLLLRTEDPADRRARQLRLAAAGKAFSDRASLDRVALLYETVIRKVPASAAKAVLAVVSRVIE